MTNASHPDVCTTNERNAITQELLHSILDYDPVTTRLVPKPSQPKLGLTAAKFGKRHLLIGGYKVSMAKLAYLYHHGAMLSMVTHIDKNKDNYAPDNLTQYIPQGRGASRPQNPNAPIPYALHDYSGGYIPAFKAPLNPKYPPTRRIVVVTAVDGTSLGTYDQAEYARRIARDNISNLTREDLIDLGVIPPTAS